MASSASARPVRDDRGSSARRRRRSAVKAPSSASASSEESNDPADLVRLRQKRSSYYTKSPTERTRAARPMAQERRAAEVERTSRTAASANAHVVGARTSVTHRRRRKRRSKDEEHGKGGDFVYRTATTATAPKRSVTVTERIVSSSRTSLGLPQRRTSQRTIRSTAEEPIKRRHSYHGNVRAKRTRDVSHGESRGSLAPKRSTSLRESPRASSSKTSLTRSQTTKSRWTRSTLPAVPEHGKLPSPRPRPISMFGSIFSPSKPPLAPEIKATCLTCLDDVPISRTAKLDCSHRMCRACLKRIFTMSVTDPAHMPPKCCTSDCIPLRHVDKLFDTKFKIKWNRKYQEYTTQNRLYCPMRGCGAWIRPKDIKPDPSLRGRRYGKCARCRTKICATCNNRWHAARECPHDEETIKFVEMAKEQGWQRCFNCQATVELKEGCNHMTCRCTAQFCMICGAKWKTCDCPWFNYATVEADRLEHINVAQVRRMAMDPAAAGGLNRPRAYQEELERRLEQERQDEQLARRMQGLDLDRHLATRATPPIDVQGRPRRTRTDDPAEESWTVGELRGGNDADFLRRAASLLTSPITPGRAAQADRLVAEIRESHRDGSGSGPATPVSRASRGTPRSPASPAASPSIGSPHRSPRRSRPRLAELPMAPAPVMVVQGPGRDAERSIPRRNLGDGSRGYAAQAERLRPRKAAAATATPAANATTATHARRAGGRGGDEDAEGDEIEEAAYVRRSRASPMAAKHAAGGVAAAATGASARATVGAASASIRRNGGFAMEPDAVRENPRGKGKGKATEKTSMMVDVDAAGSGAEAEEEAGEEEKTTPAAKLAGLHRGTTRGRVDAWRRHVEPGIA